MTIQKEILVYHNIPHKKYRWISYMSAVQVVLMAANLFALPTTRAVEQRQEAKEERIKKKEEKELSVFSESKPATEEPEIKVSKSVRYIDIFSWDNLVENVTSKPYTAAGLVGASCLIITAAFNYSYRMVHMITLLPNKQVRFSFFSPVPFTKPPTINIPLANVSCRAPRASQNNYSILKLKGYMGYHLVHKQEGEFLEPELYDQYLGYERSWSKSK